MEPQKMSRVTMKVAHVNPDADVNFTVTGIGKDRNEASIFALGSFLNVMNGISFEGISDYTEALEMAEGQFTTEEIKLLAEGKMSTDKNSFWDSTKVEYSWDEIEGETPEGIISELEIIEEEEEEEEDQE